MILQAIYRILYISFLKYNQEIELYLSIKEITIESI
jgi:hypothetical protein